MLEDRYVLTTVGTRRSSTGRNRTTAFLELEAKQTGRALFGSLLALMTLLPVSSLCVAAQRWALCNLLSMFRGGERTLASKSPSSSLGRAGTGVCATGRLRRNGFDPDIWKAWSDHGSNICSNEVCSSQLAILLTRESSRFARPLSRREDACAKSLGPSNSNPIAAWKLCSTKAMQLLASKQPFLNSFVHSIRLMSIYVRMQTP